MTTPLLSNWRSGLNVDARWVPQRDANRGHHILVEVANAGGDPVRVANVYFRVSHDTALRTDELPLANCLEGGPRLPLVIDADESIAWHISLRGLQRLLYEDARREDEPVGVERRGAEPAALSSAVVRLRDLAMKLRDEPWRLPTGIQQVVRHLIDKPATIVVRDDWGHRHGKAKINWGVSVR